MSNANLLIWNWFYKRLFFFFYLTTEILRSSLLLRIFECGFWNKKCALTCQETLFWTVRRCEENWGQKSSFSVEWLKTYSDQLWQGNALSKSCSPYIVEFMACIALTLSCLVGWQYWPKNWVGNNSKTEDLTPEYFCMVISGSRIYNFYLRILTLNCTPKVQWII